MKSLTCIVVLGLVFGAAGCHFFDDFDSLDDPLDKCEMNSGYPCPCDPTDSPWCDDGTNCATWDGVEGMCSKSCWGFDDYSSCNDNYATQGYGLQGSCVLKTAGATDYDRCAIICELKLTSTYRSVPLTGCAARSSEGSFVK